MDASCASKDRPLFFTRRKVRATAACILNHPPPGLVPSCAEGGVLGILPGIIGLIQATEVIKLILNKGETLIGRLMIFDALGMKFREMRLRKDEDCPICGNSPTIRELIDYEQFCGIAQEEANFNDTTMEISTVDVKRMLDDGEKFTLVDVREPLEYDICRIDGSVLVPLSQIEEMRPQNLHSLSHGDVIILYCKAGLRSLKAAKALKKIGFKNVRSMAGGIEEWSKKIDSSMPRY